MEVISTYEGSKSDYLRSYFQSNLRENIQKEYLDYYSNLYPYIELNGDIEIIDEDRNTFNILISLIWETNKFVLSPKFLF